MSQHYVAALDLLALPPSGEPIPVAFRVGLPEALADGEWACAVRLDGLYDDMVPMHGGDSMQALCLALGLTATLLRGFVADGGRLTFAGPDDGGDADWPIQAYFGHIGAFSAAGAE